MNKLETQKLIALVTANVLAALNTQAETPVSPERKAARKVIADKVKRNGDKAASRKAAKTTGQPVITALASMSLEQLLTRAAAEVHANTDGPNAKRIPLVPNDLRPFITRATNAALKMHCRDKGNGVSITEASRLLVSKYDKTQGKGSARAQWALWA